LDTNVSKFEDFNHVALNLKGYGLYSVTHSKVNTMGRWSDTKYGMIFDIILMVIPRMIDYEMVQPLRNSLIPNVPIPPSGGDGD